ncbi:MULTISPECIES: hypothetical protein [Komagataeibacter]|uniref:hypothetical protein n=1 Tax=Komagataeibacter TaxID=1434011 RepID=UPI0011AF96F2|nr:MULTISPECIES: hypothetical protein [Komagataeibacter]
MSELSLKSQHKAIFDCLNIDDSLAASGKDTKYGVRIHQDWKEQKDEIESELTRRGISYTPITI